MSQDKEKTLTLTLTLTLIKMWRLVLSYQFLCLFSSALRFGSGAEFLEAASRWLPDGTPHPNLGLLESLT